MILGFGFQVQLSGFRSWFWISGFRCQVSDFWFLDVRFFISGFYTLAFIFQVLDFRFVAFRFVTLRLTVSGDNTQVRPSSQI